MKNKLVIRSLFILCFLSTGAATQPLFHSEWNEEISRAWIGPGYWANRIQDWRVMIGRLECIQTDPEKPMRTVHLLTHNLSSRQDTFSLEVRTGLLGHGIPGNGNCWSGFLVGAGEQGTDYRSAALVHHFSGKGGGLIAALDDSGQLVFRSNESNEPRDTYPLVSSIERKGKLVKRGVWQDNWEDIVLRLTAYPSGDSTYTLKIVASSYPDKNMLQEAIIRQYPASQLTGNVALVSHTGMTEKVAKRYWFRDFSVDGGKFDVHPERRFGPILNAMYSLNGSHLKMNLQFPPLGFGDAQEVTLLLKTTGDPQWKKSQTVKINPLSYTALFELDDWDHKAAVHYGFEYDGSVFPWGQIAPEPIERTKLKIAAINCFQVLGLPADDSFGSGYAGEPRGRWTKDNLWFPNPVSDRLIEEQPDLLALLGDQIYESGNPTKPDLRERNSRLDYLYKWFIFLWNFKDATRNQPTVVLMDDHDVYQGDLWGDGGAPSVTGYNKEGGYILDAAFVRMTEATQTAHNPEPYSSKLLKQGLASYYGAFRYAGIGFALLEDRKFKSLPNEVRKLTEMNGSKIADKNFDPEKARIRDGKILGKEQLQFLQEWVKDWTGEYMKLAFSQTIFSSLHTDPGGYKWLDLDSNGWPQSARDRALKVLRKGHVPLVSGDTHLPVIVQHGIEHARDASYQFVVPAVVNKYRRWWNPSGTLKGEQRKNYGDQLDGFGNKVTVHAVGNPYIPQQQVFKENKAKGRGYASEHIYLDATKTRDGYGVIILDKESGQITFEAKDAQGKMHNEWPLTITQAMNYENKGNYQLPVIKLGKLENPLVRVERAGSNELLYNFRLFNKKKIRLAVAEAGTYNIYLFDMKTGQKVEIMDQESTLVK